MIAATLSVLVLDLSESPRKDPTVSAYLRDKGYTHEWVRTVRQAEMELKKGQVKLVLMALPLRAASSPTPLLERLHQWNGDVPIIVLSPRPSVEQAAAAVRGRAFDYLPAPFDERQLDGAFEALIEEKGYTRARPDQPNHLLGERLRRARQERSLTLRQLSNRTGLSVSLLSQIELARSSPSVATLFKMSRALKLAMSDLFQDI